MFEPEHEPFESMQEEVCSEVLAMAAEVGYVYARDVEFEMDLDSAEVTDALAALASDGLVDLVGISDGQAAVLTTRGQWVAVTRFDSSTVQGEGDSG